MHLSIYLDENIKLYDLKDYDDAVVFILYKYYNIF
jgi:hypothetical protein